MHYPINIPDISGDHEFYADVMKLHGEAVQYLKSHSWCKDIRNSFLYINIGHVFCVFLFEIENTASAGDAFLWVVTGDIPAMYLDIHGVKTTRQVMERYVDLAEDWIYQIEMGEPIDNCFPFKAEPTLRIAELLKRKISFIKGTLIDNLEDLSIA